LRSERGRDRDNANQFWEDSNESLLEDRLSDVFAAMLVEAETSYRDRLLWNREWIIERKASAAAELQRRKDEAERKARELAEKAARERIARLLAQAKALERANQIRAYVDTAMSRARETAATPADVEQWAL
jgi:hypothetical protein